MIVTFALEVLLALYTVWRYKWGTVTRLAVALFVFLAIFQLAEFWVCRGIGGGALLWSRVGFVSITMLPPLGIHLVYAIAGVRRRPLLLPAYAAAAGFIGFFAFMGRSLDGHACQGNYVIFQVASGLGGLFGLYYYVLLAITLGLGWYFIRHIKEKKVKKALTGLMLGYAVFLIPTITVNFLHPETLSAIPSVMCGFAILLALVLSFIVLPLSARRK